MHKDLTTPTSSLNPTRKSRWTLWLTSLVLIGFVARTTTGPAWWGRSPSNSREQMDAKPESTAMARAAGRQIYFINAAHCLTHYALLILPTAVLAMTSPAGAFGADYGTI